MSSYIQAYPSNAAVVLNNEVYIFYYDLQSEDLCFLKSTLGKGPISSARRSGITITKGRNRGPVRRAWAPNNNTINPLAAAADPASGTVWVYYTDIQGMVNNASTTDGGSNWASGGVIDAQIAMTGNHNMSVWYDPAYPEPRIVALAFDYPQNYLSEAYDDDGSWRAEGIQP